MDTHIPSECLRTFLCCPAVLPVMLRQNRGKIINVTSSVGTQGRTIRPVRHMAAYASSKAAITQLTEFLSEQLVSKNIQVNAMTAGGNTRMLEELLDHSREIDDTEMFEYTQQVIAADPIEPSAALAVFLASEDSGDLSGRVIRRQDDFRNRIPEIMASDAYTLRRVELD